MKCSICGKENVTLIVPPDKPVCYCLRCVSRDLSKNWQLLEEQKHVISIVVWLEKRGHILPKPEVDLVLGEPSVTRNVHLPPKGLKK